MKVENCQNLSYDTLSVIVKFGGQNWPNIKWALQGFSGLFFVFYGIFMVSLWLKNGHFTKNHRKLILSQMSRFCTTTKLLLHISW